MTGTPPWNKRCWCKGCNRLAVKEITWQWNKVKVCKECSKKDGIHWYWTNEGYQQVCWCKKKGHK